MPDGIKPGAAMPPVHDGRAEFGFTFGASHTQSAWQDARRVSWERLVEILTSHVPGPKEGSCLVPAVFTGTSRKKEEAVQIDVAFLDSDSGATLDDIVAALKKMSWEAVVSSTHSHMTTQTQVSLVNWDRFFAKFPNASPADFLESEKSYLPSVASGAAVAKKDDTYVYLTHQPCPKFRIAIPLQKPWRAADYNSQAAANGAWKERIEALAGALALPHDQACTDTSRLFYLPRRPPNGAVPETAVVAGGNCDLFGLPGAVAEHDLLSATPTRIAPKQEPSGRLEYMDPITGELLDLTSWAKATGRDFLIAKALKARKPGVLTGLIVDNCKVHIDCPNANTHTNAGRDNATFVVNAGNGETKGFVIHCRHAHCTGKDRLFFVARMLEERWLEIEDLTSEQFLDKSDKPADLEPPPELDDPAYWNSVEIDARETVYPDPKPEEPLTPEITSAVLDPWNALRPVAFPLAAIPPLLAAMVDDRARVIGADPAALAWAALSACSAAVNGRIRLQMKRHDNWTVPPAIWVALVGAPSSKKTPIVDAAWAPLHRAQAGDLSRHQQAQASWQSLPKAQRAVTPEPAPARRLVSHDATMEALQGILATQSRGIGVLRDELAGWIGSMEKYAPGKGGAADRAFALQSYNGVPHVVDRIGRGTLPIENLLTTMCGGIQPDRLRQFGDLTDDGLWQRFIPIIVAPASIGIDRAAGDETAAYETLVRYLLDVPGEVRLILSEEAHTVREDVQRRIFHLEQAEVLGPRFVGFCGKLVGLWGRLALVMHLLVNRDSSTVSRTTAEAARTLLFKSVLPNAARVYTAMGGAGGDLEATQSIAGYILTKRLRRIVMSDLTSNVRVCRHQPADQVRKLLSPLEAGGWLLPEKDWQPTSWLVNDGVHVKFADRASRETERREQVRALIAATLGDANE